MTAAQFNKKYPVGTPVKYHPVIGRPEHWETETRSTAWTLPSGHVVVQIKGRSGSVSINAIEKLDRRSQ